MALTPETLTRHELNGLRVEVVDAANPDLVGIAGRIVVETMRTLHVDTGSRVSQVPKQGATLRFEIPSATDPDTGSVRTDEAADADKASGTASKLPSETAGGLAGQSEGLAEDTSAASRNPSENCEGVAYVTVDGARLLSRPALRTEKAGDSTWR
ncbi:ribonuclease P protein component 1 [Halopelagius longus]|uniref:Ribonuclease P protein component 1 n=1 Tax=Halopelagius longus TaxID=1236180 RepID=A0A1H0YEZ0_9EURY|nr:ribonuclease P protein component 1 [Halopelagius longus]RDI72454.1 ribonuclease P [Halopelagius longus]SDQ13757.1 ribonuclease P protein subunit POP4 [Halopelagius longus]